MDKDKRLYVINKIHSLNDGDLSVVWLRLDVKFIKGLLSNAL